MHAAQDSTPFSDLPIAGHASHVSAVGLADERRKAEMPRPISLAGRLRGFIDTFGAAADAAASVRLNKRPSARALETLGIDPRAFDDIRL
jgi:hypothetical protein